MGVAQFCDFLSGWKIFRSGIFIKEIEFFKYGFFLFSKFYFSDIWILSRRIRVLQIWGFSSRDRGYSMILNFYHGTWGFLSRSFLSRNQKFLRPWDFYHGHGWFFRYGNFYPGHWEFFWSDSIPLIEQLLTRTRVFYLGILISSIVDFWKSRNLSYEWIRESKIFVPEMEIFFLGTVFTRERSLFQIGQASPSFELSPVSI